MPSKPITRPHAPITVWLAALRLRTLPLAGAAMLAAAMLAWQQQVFQAALFIASLSTAVLLPIFRNLPTITAMPHKLPIANAATATCGWWQPG